MKTIYTLFSTFILGQLFAQNTLLSDHFNYPAGDSLTSHGWYAHSAAATSPILVGTPGLSWDGYIGSGIGNAALVVNNGQDVNKPFSANASEGAVYASFLVHVDAQFPAAGEGVFFHLGYYDNLTPDAQYGNLATAFRARTFVLLGSNPATQFKLGLSFNATTSSGQTSDLNIGETYLVVVKYQFIEGESNDEVSLFVFAAGDDISAEPTNPTIGPFTGTQIDAPAIQAVALRQFNVDQNVQVDGIYVKDAWDIEACELATGTDTRTECAGYTWIDGNTYDESNNSATFLIVGGAASGCDSLVTLNLTIVEINTDVTASANTLTSAASGATYQWLDCGNNNSPIEDEINASFTAEVSGSYAVEVTQNGCSATSECIPVTVVGLEDASLSTQFTIFPNPSSGEFMVSWKTAQHVNLHIVNALGQNIAEFVSEHGTSTSCSLDLPSGIYFLELVDENGIAQRHRIIIE